MTRSSTDKGAAGEDIAVRYLRGLGYKILDRNVRLSRFEIDIVCRDGECLVFVEVKHSPSGRFGHPATWIDDRKRQHLRQAAEAYLAAHQIDNTEVRFDAITIQKGAVEHFPNAFQ